MATKTATILVRLEPEIKERADRTLARLGMTISSATNIFLHQVIQEGGLPFRPHTTKPNIPDMNEMTDEEIIKLLDESMEDIRAGKAESAEKVFAELRAEYGF